jgi:UDP-N-acetyl-D-glucosamine dehydrogenase
MNKFESVYSALRAKIEARQARVAVIGLGYVGLPLALTVHEAGFDVTGLDINAARVADISAGRTVISYLGPDRIGRAVASGRFRATNEAACLAGADVILICVPTPLSGEREPLLDHVLGAGGAIAERLRPGQLVILESTVWPGATGGVLRPLLERGGLVAGTDFFLGFSPEREDPGNDSYSTRTIPKLVSADDPHSLDLVDLFYASVLERTVRVGATATAEAAKLTENTFRAVNIGLVNELKEAFEGMGVDVWEVIDAAATKPFGFMPFYPGPGIGGDCIPVSPIFLSWRARDVGSGTPIVDLVCRRNEGEPGRLAARIAGELAVRRGRQVEGSRLLVLGISYKRDVEDSRVSPSLALLCALEAHGAACDYHDPFFPLMPPTRDFPQLAGRESVGLTREVLAGYDAVILATDHSAIDYGLVAEAAPLIFDTRNAFARRGVAATPGRIVKI